MEKDFFELYLKHSLLCLDVGHSSITDWTVRVHDRRGKPAGQWGDPVVAVQDPHREAAFAKAYTLLVEYFSEKFDGY